MFFPVIDTEAYSLIDEPKLTGTPERRLLLAILERSILDFVGNDQVEVQEARTWIFGDTPPENLQESYREYTNLTPFSFAWVCQELDLDAKNISSVIAAMPRRGNQRVAPWYFNKTAEGSPGGSPGASPASKINSVQSEYTTTEQRQTPHTERDASVSTLKNRTPEKHLRLVKTVRGKKIRPGTMARRAMTRKTMARKLKSISPSDASRSLELVCA